MKLSEEIQRIERDGVMLERWQWDSLAEPSMPRLRTLAVEHGLGSFVYFLQDGEAIKIGVAADPTKRLAELQTGNPRQLVLRELIVGDGSVEKRLHRMWTRRRALIRDEWFGEVDGILKLASHIAVEQLRVLDRGLPLGRRLSRCVDEALANHKAILAAT